MFCGGYVIYADFFVVALRFGFFGLALLFCVELAGAFSAGVMWRKYIIAGKQKNIIVPTKPASPPITGTEDTIDSSAVMV